MTKLWLLSASELATPRFSIQLFNQGAMPPLTAGIVAVIYLLWVIVSWPLPTETLAPANDASSATVSVSTADTSPDYLEIADWHLFGQDKDATQESVTALVSTPLQLKLLGTFVLSDEPDNSYAIIQSSDGGQQKYRVGEALPEDALLQSVEINRVVLKHLQRLEYLEFEPNPVTLSAPNQ